MHCAALDDVPGCYRARETIPIGPLPAEMPGGRTDDDRGVGHAWTDDDVGALRERFDDAPSAEVGIGA